MRLHRFQYHEPRTLKEALVLRERFGQDARFLAGGTALLVMIRHRLVTPAHVISLAALRELRGVRETRGVLRIGALTSHAEVVKSDLVRRRAPLLADAVAKVATPAVRNAGTLGGSLCYAESASDPSAALLALEARAVVAGREGRRTISLPGEFFRGFYETSMADDEILVEIEVPAQSAAGTYVKFSPRSAEDRPLVGVAATADVRRGICHGVRLGLSGVNPTPVRLGRAEAVAKEAPLTDDLITGLARAAASEVEPVSDVHASADYRRRMTEVWVARALRSIRDGAVSA